MLEGKEGIDIPSSGQISAKIAKPNDVIITLLAGRFSGSTTDAWEWRGDHYISVPRVLHVVSVHLVQ